MYRFLALVFAFGLAMLPVGALAQTAPYPFPYSITIGQNYTSGLCVTTGAAGVLQDTACSGGGSGATFIPLWVGLNQNLTNGQSPLTALAYGAVGYAYNIPVGFVIGHLNVTCEPYNAADSASSVGPYTPLNSNGLGGGTITFAIVNGTYPESAPFTLGSVVIPTSAQTGPYVVSATSTVGTPYTVLANDGLTFEVTAVSGTAAQWVVNCSGFVGP